MHCISKCATKRRVCLKFRLNQKCIPVPTTCLSVVVIAARIVIMEITIKIIIMDSPTSRYVPCSIFRLHDAATAIVDSETRR